MEDSKYAADSLTGYWRAGRGKGLGRHTRSTARCTHRWGGIGELRGLGALEAAMKGSRNVATSFLASRGAKFLIALPLVLAAFALLLQVRTCPSQTVCLHPATDALRYPRSLEAPECWVAQVRGLPLSAYAANAYVVDI